jgi:hypothetical protein
LLPKTPAGNPHRIWVTGSRPPLQFYFQTHPTSPRLPNVFHLTHFQYLRISTGAFFCKERPTHHIKNMDGPVRLKTIKNSPENYGSTATQNQIKPYICTGFIHVFFSVFLIQKRPACFDFLFMCLWDDLPALSGFKQITKSTHNQINNKSKNSALSIGI